MRIGLLLIGSELLQGKIRDANQEWLSHYLRSFNWTLHQVNTVHDGVAEIKKGLSELFDSCELVITSGGLGPTPDDMTKSCLAEFFQQPLEASSQAKDIARGNYQRLGREFPEGHVYASLPRGFIALENPSGFAPGLYYAHGGTKLLAAPGVPKEFRDLLQRHFPSLIVQEQPSAPLHMLNIRTFGVAEEKIFSQLCPGLWEQLSVLGQVSSLPFPLGVDIGITLRGDIAAKTKAVNELIMQSPLAPHVWHWGFESLEEVVLAKARKLNLRFVFAESCTGGLSSHRITNIPGSSDVFLGGVVSYANSLKEAALNVAKGTLEAHGAVSETCAREMAEGARKNFAADLAVAITGIAGPGGGSSQKPVGTVWISIASQSETKAWQFCFKGDRENLKLRFSQIMLFKLLEHFDSTGVS